MHYIPASVDIFGKPLSDETSGPGPLRSILRAGDGRGRLGSGIAQGTKSGWSTRLSLMLLKILREVDHSDTTPDESKLGTTWFQKIAEDEC